ncbi:MAG: hypothetical protein ACLU37_04800 [Collinsella sp.]
MAQSLPGEVPARLVAVDWRQLANNGSEDAAFSQYNVRSVIGTDNPHADGVRSFRSRNSSPAKERPSRPRLRTLARR